MCERLVFALDENIPIEEAREVISSGDGRRSMMKLTNRMVKDFCAVLNMSRQEFPQLMEASNGGIRVSVRRNKEGGQPDGLVVTASTSSWLPILHQTVFELFMDDTRRAKWDVLSSGSLQIHQIAGISNGSHPSNCIRIIQPLIPNDIEGRMLILQETLTDSSGSMLVYAPIDMPLINMCVRGMETCLVPILPSGFVISGDGRRHHHHPLPLFPGDQSSSCSSNSNNNEAASSSSSTSSPSPSGGSLITVSFQILVCSNDEESQLNVETLSTINSLVTSTVDNIKEALNCAGVD